jgi:hypothetical protein
MSRHERIGRDGKQVKFIIIKIIKNQQPLSSLAIPELVFDKLEYVDRWILTPGNFCLVGDIAETLLEPSRVTCMYPENPGSRQLASDSIRVFDTKLRFPVDPVSTSSTANLCALTRRRRCPQELS